MSDRFCPSWVSPLPADFLRGLSEGAGDLVVWVPRCTAPLFTIRLAEDPGGAPRRPYRELTRMGSRTSLEASYLDPYWLGLRSGKQYRQEFYT